MGRTKLTSLRSFCFRIAKRKRAITLSVAMIAVVGIVFVVDWSDLLRFGGREENWNDRPVEKSRSREPADLA